jgi:mannosyltransferase
VIALAGSVALVLLVARLATGGRRASTSRADLIAFLVVSAALGTVARLWDLDRSLWRDEFGTLWAIEGGLAGSIRRVTDFHGQTPFYYLFVWPLIHTFGESEVALRLPSLLFGAAAAVVVGASASLLAGRTAGLVAAGLAWLSSALTGASVNARPYALGMLCAGCALYGFVGAVQRGDRRYRLIFVLGGAALVFTHYLFALVLVGVPAGYLLFPSLRANYPPRAFIADIAWQGALSSVALPQFLTLWGRKASLVWTRQPDYLAVLRTLAPLAVPALLSGQRPAAPRERALAFTLWLSVGGVVGILAVASLAGTNLVVPRYVDVIVVPAAILAGVGAARAVPAARFLGLAYMVGLTVLASLAVFRTTGRLTAIPHEEWRGAVDALTQAAATRPGPVLLQSGFVEQVDAQADPDSATRSPLRSPGRPAPALEVHLLPYAWNSAAAAAGREDVARLFDDPSRPVYVLSGGGYTTLFVQWVNARFAGRVSCRPLGAFVRVELVACRQGSSGAK